ncbi:hypothetical protein QUC31_016375 [Theobroma cacao]
MLWSIFNRLDVIDIIRAKLVCSSWNSLGEELVPRTPWLMLPSKEEVEGRYDADNNAYSGLLKLGESQVCSPKKIPKEFRESCCIGSSNGWLIFLEEKAMPFLFHPFRRVKIRLPSLYAMLGLQRMERKADGVYDISYFEDSEDYFRLITCQHKKQHLREYFMQKAILTGEPDCNNKKYGGFMRKIRYIEPPFPEKSLAKRNSLGDLCASRLYLVESCGDILLRVRFIGEFVESDGTLISEEDALYGIGIQPKVCPYRTFLFHVHKLDFIELKWVEMNSLDDCALFLGGNQSVSVSVQSFANCEKNSIYYTDDYWDRMTEDYSYGGHDLGKYNLNDGSVKPIYEFSLDNVLPPPCWIIPNPKPC